MFAVNLPCGTTGEITERASATDDLMTVRQFCGIIGVSRDTFYRWRQLGHAPTSHRLPNGSLRITRADYEAWLKTLRDEST
jgi:predicted DNA-binding transcriptional regulator AlpA